MGLDMYLYRKTYVQNWDFEKKKFKVTVMYGKEKLPLEEVCEVVEKVGYWRKSNQIHNWFVENVQEGNDDCRSYEVSRRQLKELLELCKKVMKTAVIEEGEVCTGTTYSAGEVTHSYEKGRVVTNPDDIADLLPSQEGFFFGSTDYDEYYLQDIEQTIKILEKILSAPEIDGVMQWFEYRSSW